MTLIEELPTLYGVEKNGKIRTWSASIHSNDTMAWALIEFGQMDGKKQITKREYTAGKNIGKKNETTFLDQCLSETKKKWLDKKDKEQYSLTTVVNVSEKVFPMLAQTYDPTKTKKSNTITYPCYVQPKLDGLRCVVYQTKDKEIAYQSRSGMYFETLSHLNDDIKAIFTNHPSLVLDGELYTKDYPFEELAGLIKKKKLSEEDKQRLRLVKYHIYDIINEADTFEKRCQFLEREIKTRNNLVQVETLICESLNNFREYFSRFVGEEGYEGVMLRNKEGLYRVNYRSHDLQKYKEFQEAEYEIVGFREGEGRDEGTVLWTCKTPEGKTFSVRPKGSVAMRKAWFENGIQYVGKNLTVIYQELSEMGVPRFPVGKDIREHY